MAQEQETQTSNKEMNIKENSAETDSISGNETTGESSWRLTEGEVMKEPTENATGAAGKSPAQPKSDNVVE